MQKVKCEFVDLATQSRDYGGGFLYGQPELFGSLGDGLLASRSEVMGSGGGIGGNGGGGGSAGSGGGGNNHGHVQGLNGGNHPDGIKPLARHDTSGFLHPHSGLQVTSSGSLQSQNGRQQVTEFFSSLVVFYAGRGQPRYNGHSRCRPSAADVVRD